jgi:acyl dehydratase
MNNSSAAKALDVDALTGHRLGPYNSFHPVTGVQIWQWCRAMGDDNPLYLDPDYHARNGLPAPLAPPTMMQMWTMRDIEFHYAPGSTTAPPYQVFDELTVAGFPANVAVSYDITFLRYLSVGDRAHHYTTVVSISAEKQTALGRGHFVTERVEYLDQHEHLFAEAYITYFQYHPAAAAKQADAKAAATPPQAATDWVPDFSDLRATELATGDALPELAIPITHKLIVGGAIASQDYIEVHHNAPAARAAAMPDIFMNILTTCGLTGRYLSDWAGPASRLEKLSFRLMAPNVPGDTMVLGGRIEEITGDAVSVGFEGRNSRGLHVAGKATVRLAAAQ